MQTKTFNFLSRNAHLEYSAQGKALWKLVVRADELPPGLPYGPNARNPKPTAKTIRAMERTLRDEPGKFILYNNGMMLLAKEISTQAIPGQGYKVEVSLEVPESDEDCLGQGLINGGHTYRALTLAKNAPKRFPQLSDAAVELTVLIGAEESEVAAISQARNTSEKVPVHALKNLGSEWDSIRDNLPPQYLEQVTFRGNEDLHLPRQERAPYSVVDLVKRLSCLNNDLYPWQNDSHPIKSYTAVGSLVKGWQPLVFAHVVPRLGDILWLEEQIRAQMVTMNGTGAGKVVIAKVSGCSDKPQKQLNGELCPLTIADSFALPVLAAFRVFLDDDGWIIPLDSLWKACGPKLVTRLWETYKVSGNSSSSAFGHSKATWGALVNSAIQLKGDIEKKKLTQVTKAG
jgi:hypothetical protein